MTTIKVLNDLEFERTSTDNFLISYQKASLGIQIKNKVMTIQLRTKTDYYNNNEEYVEVTNPEETILKDLGIELDYSEIIESYKKKRDIELKKVSILKEENLKLLYKQSWVFIFINNNKEDAEDCGLLLEPSHSIEKLIESDQSVEHHLSVKATIEETGESIYINRATDRSSFRSSIVDDAFQYFYKIRYSPRYKIIKNLFKSFITKIENEINEKKIEAKKKAENKIKIDNDLKQLETDFPKIKITHEKKRKSSYNRGGAGYYVDNYYITEKNIPINRCREYDSKEIYYHLAGLRELSLTQTKAIISVLSTTE